MQRTGYMATSLTEIKNRADVIIVFGNKLFEKSPRLLEKVLQAKNSLCSDIRKKEIILIGDFSQKVTQKIKKSSRVTNIKLNLDMIPSLMNLLSSDTKPINAKFLSKNNFNKIKKIISNSKYLVATWTGSDFFKSKNPEKIISSISKYIVNYNENKRGACAPIAGPLGDITSSQTLAWMTGFASRIKFTENTFHHDRMAYDGDFLVNNKNIDVVIHISTISSNKLEINKNLYNIVLGHPNTKFTNMPDIFIPVGIPGIDYDGIMFRTDNVVSVALKNIRDIKLPTTENIINRLT
jgi:formylmethanofuran dehydrogenase subunit B